MLDRRSVQKLTRSPVLNINETLGFEHVGTLKEVGRKFGKLLDVHIMQLILD